MYIEGLWRYPVKSMLGEKLDEAYLGEMGVAGDRSYALVDAETGMVVTAKNPKLWSKLLTIKASLQNGQLAIHLPAGRKLDMENADDLLSQYLGRRVRLVAQACGELEYLGYWPRIGELIHRSEYEVGKTLSGTFFDSAPIHLITSENIQSIARVIPSGKVGVERFRPNILLGAESDLDERKVLGVSLQVGEAHIKVIRRTRRCVVTTLPQHGLDTDLNILKTIYRLYGGYAGFYAEVLRPGVVRVGDAVKLL